MTTDRDRHRNQKGIRFASMLRGPKEVDAKGSSIYYMSGATEDGMKMSSCVTCGWCCENDENNLIELTDADLAYYRKKAIPIHLLGDHMIHGTADLPKSFQQQRAPEDRGKCQNLTVTGCGLKKHRPTFCKWWPLVVDRNNIAFDLECPSVKSHTWFQLRQMAKEAKPHLLALGKSGLYSLSRQAQELTDKELVYVGVYLDDSSEENPVKAYKTAAPLVPDPHEIRDTKGRTFSKRGSIARLYNPLILRDNRIGFLTSCPAVQHTPLHVLADVAMRFHPHLMECMTQELLLDMGSLHAYTNFGEQIMTDVFLNY